jgi:sterol 3beta-glucosyltransferase
MRILITTFGTQGDIQPFIALAKGLQKAGHDAAICAPEAFQHDLERHHLHMLRMDNELLDLSQQLLDERSGGAGAKIRIARKIGSAVRHLMDDEWQAAQAFQPDLIIYHPKCLGSYHIAEKLDIPAVMSIPLPFYTPTNAFPVPFIGRDLGKTLNRLTYHLIPLSNAAYAGSVNDFRQKALSLRPIGRFADLLKRGDGTPVPVLYPISPAVLPVPEDYPDHVHMTGYWFLDRDAAWQPSPELLEFLEAGTPPIYIGFGSMSATNTEKRTRQIIQAVQAAGQRAVLASGWSDLDQQRFPPEIFVLKSAPHDWLFPRVVAVVHHGGAGTTAAGLRAGKPTIICPFVGDQPFWGKRVHELGVGPKPIPQGRITADNLAAALIQTLQDNTMQTHAAALRERIALEDGVAFAIQTITAAGTAAD